MKHFLLKLFSFLLLTNLILPQGIMAQSNTPLQEEVLERCLTFQPLVDQIPMEVKKQISEYFILNHGTKFEFSTNFKIDDKRVSLIDKSEISPNRPYFDFFTLNIEDDKASAMYYANYNVNNIEHTIEITIQLEKKFTGWDVIKFTLN